MAHSQRQTSLFLELITAHAFGRDIDIVTRRGIENSRNPYRRKAILDSARVIYAA